MFEDLGIPLYYADQRAKQLMTESVHLRKGLKDLFGDRAFEDGVLNRSYIASVVFEDPVKLQSLNALVHPEVERDFKAWLNRQNAPYVIQEIPLLFENRKESQYDAIITVTAPRDIRIDRVVKRDKVSKAHVVQRMNNQLPEEVKIKGATFVIRNLDLEDSRRQVLEIHGQLLA